jgi:hypothetical protein
MPPKLIFTLSELESYSKDNLEKIKGYRHSYSEVTPKEIINSLVSGHGYKVLASYWSKINILITELELTGLIDESLISKCDRIIENNAENRMVTGRTDKKDIIAINDYLDELTGVLYCKFQYFRNLRKFTETKQIPYSEIPP